jgi:3-oxoacyl-[acyl-carrier-protein] synthase II
VDDSASVWITGLGIIGPQGQGRASLDALVDHPRACFSPTPADWLSHPGTPDGYLGSLPEDLQTTVQTFESVSTDRSCALALAAASEAWAQAWPQDPSAPDPYRAGVFWGTGMGGLHTAESSYSRFFADRLPLRPMTVVRIMANSAAGHLAIKYKLQGPNHTYSVACASSAIALGEALLALRSGRVDVALVGGSEAMLAPGVMSAWGALRVMSTRKSAPTPELACRPFAAGRTGLVIGEGAAAFVLESPRHARARGARPLALLSGYGSTCDAASLVHPKTEGQVRSMRMALQDAGLQQHDIGSVNAHATGTDAGDVAEALALAEVFGAHCPPISATKSLHGHLLGAAGAFEAAFCVASLQRGLLPGSLGTQPLDPRCANLDVVSGAPRPAPDLRAVVSNSFAFGGSNVSLVFQRADV